MNVEFRKTDDYKGQKSIAVVKDGEKFGWIYWSGEQYAFFNLCPSDISIEEMKLILAEMKRLTAERNKSPFCTFDE